MAGQRDVAEEVTAAILSALEEGTVPWHRPWVATGGELPRSMSTGKPYRGMNVFLLGTYAMAKGYDSEWWGTFKQIQANGGKVRKGEKASMIVFYKTLQVEDKEKTERTGELSTKQIPLLRYFNVFNACQCEDLPEKFTAKAPLPGTEHDRMAEAEAVVEDYVNRGPMLNHRNGDGAWYSPMSDLVNIPELDTFLTAEGYYSTLFHELTHSTGHAKRLDRPGVVEGHRFGSPMYAKEELVAEMGAAMLCARVGIEQEATLPNSAAYVASWIKVLQGDKRFVLSAAALAQKAVDFIAPVENDEEEEGGD